MKIKSIKISNILSFEFKNNIDESDEVIFDDGLNILIGPNGAGKSNFLDIVSQVFKSGLMHGCRYNELIKRQFQGTKSLQQLRQTISLYNQRPHSLPKNYYANTNEMKIKISLELNDDDRKNLLFIKNNSKRIIEISDKYSEKKPNFDNSITDNEITNAKTFTFSFRDSDPSRRILNIEGLTTKIEIFVYEYFNWFQFLQYIIKLAREDEGEKWEFLKNTFALITSYRSYSDISTEILINNQYSERLNKIPDTLFSEGPRRVSVEGPIIFEYVKQNLLGELTEVYSKVSKGKIDTEGKKASEFFTSHILKNINSKLKEYHLNIEYNIDLEAVNKYIFYFERINTNERIQVTDLSSGEKEILQLIFSIYGFDIKNGLMIIDEPELHLHPQMQRIYLDLLKSLIDDLNLQFIIATHSPVFINVDSIKGVHRFFKKQNITKIVHPQITEDEKDLIRILNYTNSAKIFFDDNVILVEGPSDEYFYRVFLDKFKPKTENVEFLNIGGKNDYLLWKEFLKKYGISVAYIGDLDNIFKTNLGIMDSNKKNSVIQFFETDSTTKNKLKEPNYKNSKEYWRDLLQHIKTKQQNEWTSFESTITTKYNEKIFILKNGELEDYLKIGKNKKMEQIVEFCKSDFNQWYQNQTTEVTELQNIFNKILT